MRSIFFAALVIGVSGAALAQPAAHPAMHGAIPVQPPMALQPPVNQPLPGMTQQLHGSQDFHGNQDLPNSPAAAQGLLASPLQSRSLPPSQFGSTTGASQNCAQAQGGSSSTNNCP